MDYEDYQQLISAVAAEDAASRKISQENQTPMQEGRFLRSLDGDTMDLVHDGFRTRFRLTGIDTPEMDMKYGEEAQEFLNDLVDKNGPVKFVDQGRDRYGRTIAMMYSGKKNLNKELVKAGYAKIYKDFLPRMHGNDQKMFLDAENEAKKSRIRMWSDEMRDFDIATVRQEQTGSKDFSKYGQLPADSPGTRADMWRGLMQESGMTVDRPEGYGVGSQRSGRDNVEIASRYPHEEGFLDHALGALGYTGNVSRSFMAGLPKGKAFEYAGQALSKDRYTSPTALKEMAGIGSFGKDDGEFQGGDVADIAVDLVVDIVTDPLTWLTFGFGALAKGGTLAAKVAPKLVEGAQSFKWGDKGTEAAKRYLMFKEGTQTAVGGVLGAGTAEEDADLLERFTRIGVGMGAVQLGLKAAPKVGEWGIKRVDEVADKYALGSRNVPYSSRVVADTVDDFSQLGLPTTKYKSASEMEMDVLKQGYQKFSQRRAMAKEANRKIQYVAAMIKQGRFNALKDLDPEQRRLASRLMHEIKNHTVMRRNVALKKVEASGRYNKYRMESRLEMGSDGVQRQVQELMSPGQLRAMDFNSITRSIQKDMKKNFVPKYLDNALKDVVSAEKDKVIKSIYEWEAHNKQVIAKLNRSNKKIPHGVASPTGFDPLGHKGVVGLWWHIDDVTVKEAKEIDTFRKNYAVLRKTVPKTAQNNLELNDSYAVYAEDFAKKFLDDDAKQALEYMERFKAAPVHEKYQWWHKGLKVYDKATNFIKANMLFFSASWMKNNYFDNMMKAFVEEGYGAAFDAASLGRFKKGVFEDVWDLYSNNLNRFYKSDDLMDAFERGVLDNPLYQSMVDVDLRKHLFTKEALAKTAEKEGSISAIERGMDAWVEMIGPRSVGKIGSFVEGTARMTTYQRAKDSILSSAMHKTLKSKLSNGQKLTSREKAVLANVKNTAANIVKKTFFDYDDITYFSNAVNKRLIPFYSFYSKNMPYWVNAMTDPTKVGRLVVGEKLRKQFGRDPSQYEKEGLTDYMSGNAPRVLGRDQRGNHVYAIYPSNSMHDAVKMLNWESMMDQVVEKSHPVPKLVYEFLTGKDLFTGGKWKPSEQEMGKKGGEPRKFLFSRGFKYVAVKKALEALGADPDGSIMKTASFIKADKGNPTSSSDFHVALDKLVSTFFPHGAIDQLMGTTGKLLYRKETWGQAIMNNMLPVKTIMVTPGYQRMIRARKFKEKEDGK